jgi:tetratricopeptide (TPR) repeat protein
MTTSQTAADRNLLFGTLAVQMGFISQEQFAAAMDALSANPGKSVGDVLRERDVLAADEQALLDALVAKHLVRHGDDVSRSLAAAADLATRSIMPGTDRIPAGPGETRAPGAAPVDAYAETRAPDATGGGKMDVFATRGVAGSRVGTMAGESSSPVEPARRQGRFQIVRSHARGGLGEVFVARDGELNRDVALKEIQDRHADHEQSRSRFMLEAEITGALEHPGIVPVYGLGRYEDGRPFYAMRFIRGDSLQDAVAQFHKAEGPDRDPGERAMALRGLLRRFVDVCHAIAYAHSRGVIHRDLKPGNVMLGQFGETLVVDWGLAKPLGAASMPEHIPLSVEGPVMPTASNDSAPTYAGMAIGTPQFMAPEQAAGRIEELGPLSDVYSLGATLYAVLVGKAPLYDEKDVMKILERVQQADVPPAREVNPTVPPALDAICRKAMQLLPENRYPSAQALAADVERWLADEPITAWREPFAVRARRWVRRHRTGVTAGVAILLVGGISLAIATVLLTRANRRERAAKLEAQTNYKLARQAVDRYHTEVSEDVILHEPGMEPLRRKLLEAAREFYAKFVEQRANDPEAKAELGRAYSRLAQITADIDAPAKGIELHRQALGIFNDLLAARPSDAELLADKAATLHHLGRLLREQDQLTAARDSYTEALGLWTRLEEMNPGEERYRAEEARTRLGLGNVEQVNRKLDPAKEEYAKALNLREQLAAAHPERTDYTRDLATARHNLAMVQADAGPQNEAEANYKLALVAQEKLAAAAPKVTQYGDDVAKTHFNMGTLFAKRGQLADATSEFQTAADLFGKLADDHPTVHRFRAGQGTSYRLLALAHWVAKQDGPAEEALARAQKIYQDLSALDLRVPKDRMEVGAGYRQLADLYRQNKRADPARAAYQRALDLLEPLAAGPDALPEYKAELARTLNNRGLLAVAERQQAVADAYFRKALALWEALVAAYPENPDYAENLSRTRGSVVPAAGAGAATT